MRSSGSCPRRRTTARRDGTGTSSTGRVPGTARGQQVADHVGEHAAQRAGQRVHGVLLVRVDQGLEQAVVRTGGERRRESGRGRVRARRADRAAAGSPSQARAQHPPGAGRSRRRRCRAAGPGQRPGSEVCEAGHGGTSGAGPTGRAGSSGRGHQGTTSAGGRLGTKIRPSPAVTSSRRSRVGTGRRSPVRVRSGGSRDRRDQREHHMRHHVLRASALALAAALVGLAAAPGVGRHRRRAGQRHGRGGHRRRDARRLGHLRGDQRRHPRDRHRQQPPGRLGAAPASRSSRPACSPRTPPPQASGRSAACAGLAGDGRHGRRGRGRPVPDPRQAPSSLSRRDAGPQPPPDRAVHRPPGPRPAGPDRAPAGARPRGRRAPGRPADRAAAARRPRPVPRPRRRAEPLHGRPRYRRRGRHAGRRGRLRPGRRPAGRPALAAGAPGAEHQGHHRPRRRGAAVEDALRSQLATALDGSLGPLGAAVDQAAVLNNVLANIGGQLAPARPERALRHPEPAGAPSAGSIEVTALDLQVLPGRRRLRTAAARRCSSAARPAVPSDRVAPVARPRPAARRPRHPRQRKQVSPAGSRPGSRTRDAPGDGHRPLVLTLGGLLVAGRRSGCPRLPAPPRRAAWLRPAASPTRGTPGCARRSWSSSSAWSRPGSCCRAATWRPVRRTAR